MGKLIKKLFDFSASLIGLIILTPLFTLIAITIKLDSRGPVFFKQKRAGKDGKVFTMYKFRTMIEGAEGIGLGHEVARDDSRITRVGKILRRFGIDEFPQFVNILRGEMSFVGPRPALPHQVKKYSKFEKRRLCVKPGFISIAHTKGWNILSWKERIALDIWYIENWSLWLDIKILFKTVFIVALGKGQYGEGIVKDYE